jgi:hypothetical protein
MVSHVRTALESVKGGVDKVKVLVIGALGRCGSGAVDLFRKAGLAEYVDASILRHFGISPLRGSLRPRCASRG